MRLLSKILLFLLACFICSPIILLLTGSIMSDYELKQNLMPIMVHSQSFLGWSLIPDFPTLMQYVKVLLYMPSFYTVFWNSVKLVLCILTGQLLVGVPAAWGFASYPSGFKKLLFNLYVVLMLLPFQVTMLSQYLVFDRMGIMNTQKAIILPAVFATLPVFIIYQSFLSLPGGLMEAARIDGAKEIQIFLHIGIPLGFGGILSAAVLGFLEYWNLIEQPLAFLEDKSLWPLSLYLPQIQPEQAGYAFVVSVITLIPAVFVFILGQDYLEQGIVASGLKE